MIKLSSIDLNMVCAGVVKHPSEWKYGSFNEFVEKTQRCCIINKDELLKSLYISNFEDYENGIFKT